MCAVDCGAGEENQPKASGTQMTVRSMCKLPTGLRTRIRSNHSLFRMSVKVCACTNHSIISCARSQQSLLVEAEEGLLGWPGWKWLQACTDS